MKNSLKFLLLIGSSIIVLLLGLAIGSVMLPPSEIVAILLHKAFGRTLPSHISDGSVSIIWNIRLPRVLVGYLVGAALSVSGTVMQSVLQNPLASSFTLGVSTGAALGASLVIVTGASFLGLFTLPFVGFLFAMATVMLAMLLARKIDQSLQNQTIILIGMVLSLFLNAILNFVTSFHPDRLQQLLSWQMGSLVGRKWSHVAVLFPVITLGILLLLRYLREMDILTFGESRSQAIGINVRRVKWILLAIASLLTGSAVCFAGVIGFVDLIAPHIMRRIFGPSHRLIIPGAALFGGAFLVLADLLARTLLAPIELSVGAVTAVIGAPFFAYIFFRSRKQVSG